MKNQSVRMSRRELAGAILAAGAAVAQTPPTGPAAPPATPAGELQAAQAQNQRTAEALAKVQVPIDAEPIFHFTV